MINADIMKYAMMGFLLLTGYFFLLRAVSSRTFNKKSLPLLAFVILIIYAGVAIPMMIILNQMGSTNFVLLAMLLLFGACVLLVMLYSLFHNFREINKKALILFILYLFALSYITIFNRSEGHSTQILLHFDSINEALRMRSIDPLNHLLLNIALFVPLGFLFPLLLPHKLDHILYVGPLGLMMSTIIEATQMFLKIGQCDIEDIVANTAGAVIGLLLFKLLKPIIVKDTDEDEEEDDEEEDEEEEAQ